MKKLILFLNILPCAIFAQAFIANETSEKLFFDDFTDNTENWPLFSTEPDIKTYAAEGYYYMSRITGEKSRAVIPAFKKQENKFMIKTSIMIVSSTSSPQTVGVLFMAQADGSGGFILELNKNKQYRVRGMTSAGQYLTTGEGGWVKAKHIHGADEFNKIVIKGYNNKYDIYINDLYTFSFEKNSFKMGEFGLVLGPGAKAKMDYFYLYKIKVNMPDNLETLDLKIDSLRKENDSLKKVIETSLKVKIDSLEKANIKLQENFNFLLDTIKEKDTTAFDQSGLPHEGIETEESEEEVPVKDKNELPASNKEMIKEEEK